MTVKRQNARFPDGSVNIYSTGVLPTAYVWPGMRSDVRVTIPPELSLAVGSVQVTMAELAPFPAVLGTPLVGHLLITGAMVSAPSPKKK